MTATQLNSLLLSSTNPQRLGDWYAKALSPQTDKTNDPYRMLGFDGFYLMIDTRDDIGPANPEPGRVILNFEVPDARAVAATLDELGTTWLADIEERDGSLFATAIDPDGNYVQIVQLSEKHRAEMAAEAI